MATDLRSALVRMVPPWMSPRPLLDRGFRYLYMFGVLADVAIEATLQSMTARFPGVGTPTALPKIGRDRRIRRGISETDASYASRLARWRDEWRRAGSARAVLVQLWGFLSPSHIRMRTVATNADRAVWHVLPEGHTPADGDPALAVVKQLVAPTDWNFDGAANFGLWARFWTILYPTTISPALWEDDGTWDDPGTWGDGGTWDTTATPEEVVSVQALVNEWRGAHNKSDWILVSFNDTKFHPDISSGKPTADWGKWSKDDGGNRVSSRPHDVSFWDGA